MSRVSRLVTYTLGLVFSLPTVLHAQEQRFAWTQDQEIATSIAVGEQHIYTLNLASDQFFVATLFQQGIDLMISVYAPNGDKMEDFDSPNGQNGPEVMSFTTEEKGEYTFEVKPLDDTQPKGSYTLNVDKISPKATTKEGKVDQLFSIWDKETSPGAAIAIVQDGKIIYSKGYGSANLEYGIPISPNTVFHIASVSKQFTTFAILLLAKEGKLSLDDDIRTHIPEVPDFGEKISLRHLAHHTSGMRDQWNLLALAGWRLDDVITKEHIMKLVEKQRALNFDPGEEYLYCNTGFTLLAEVVARVSGQSFAAFCDAQIFQPLGMKKTLFYDDHERIVEGRAYSYYGSGKGFKKSVLSYANVGATSLFTTVEDLALWAMNFENPKVGDADLIQQMNTRGILNNGKEINYALGQSVGEYKGLKRIGHGGADAGYRTQLLRFPGQKFSAIVFSNLASFNPSGKAYEIADIYLADQLVEPPKEEKPSPAPADIPVMQLSPEILQTYVGRYEIQAGFVVDIRLEEGKLMAQATGQGAFELEATSETEFKFDGAGIKISFQKDEAGKVNQFILHQGGQEITAPRLAGFDPNTFDLKEFVGEYFSEELSTSYSFLVEAEKLIARHPRHPDITLTPTKTDYFSGNRWFLRGIEIVRDASGAITGCKISSGRVRNVWFKKR